MEKTNEGIKNNPTCAEETKPDNLAKESKTEKTEKVVVMDKGEFERAKLSQNLPVAIITGLIVGILCAVLWAVISVSTGYQIGYMAIGVGAAVGFCMRKTGKGIEPTFGVAAAAISLFSCILGNVFCLVGFLVTSFDISFADAFSFLTFDLIIEGMKESFSFMDLVFYVLAISAGYSFAFKKVQVLDK